MLLFYFALHTQSASHLSTDKCCIYESQILHILTFSLCHKDQVGINGQFGEVFLRSKNLFYTASECNHILLATKFILEPLHTAFALFTNLIELASAVGQSS